MWYCLHTAAGLRCGLSPRVRALHTHCDAGRFSSIRADLTVILLLCSMCAFLHAGRRVLHVFAVYLVFRNDLPAQVDTHAIMSECRTGILVSSPRENWIC